jgi:hypothetical protein
MSKAELLFDPRALARVANAVEWEGELRYYKDGHSNQEFYIQATSMLMERWLAGFAWEDMLLALHAAGGGDWPGLLRQGLSTIEQKVQQLRGFWEGFWYGANPKGTSRSTFVPWSPIPFVPMPVPIVPAEPDLEGKVLSLLSSFFATLREASDDTFTRPPPAAKGGP